MPHKASWMFFNSTGVEFTVLWRKQSVLWQTLLHNARTDKMNIDSVTVWHCSGETETLSNVFCVVCYN